MSSQNRQQDKSGSPQKKIDQMLESDSAVCEQHREVRMPIQYICLQEKCSFYLSRMCAECLLIHEAENRGRHSTIRIREFFEQLETFVSHLHKPLDAKSPSKRDVQKIGNLAQELSRDLEKLADRAKDTALRLNEAVALLYPPSESEYRPQERQIRKIKFVYRELLARNDENDVVDKNLKELARMVKFSQTRDSLELKMRENHLENKRWRQMLVAKDDIANNKLTRIAQLKENIQRAMQEVTLHVCDLERFDFLQQQTLGQKNYLQMPIGDMVRSLPTQSQGGLFPQSPRMVHRKVDDPYTLQLYSLDRLNNIEEQAEATKHLVLELERYNFADAGTVAAANAVRIKFSASLESLTMYLGNNFIRKPGATAIGECLTSCKKLQKLKLVLADDNNFDYWNQIGADGTTKISQGINAIATQLKFLYLNLSSNNIGDTGLISLSGAIENAQRLEELDLRLTNNGIGTEGFTRFVAKAAKALRGATNLSLALQHNKIGEDGAKALSDVLKNEQGEDFRLEKLSIDLRNTGLGEKVGADNVREFFNQLLIGSKSIVL